MSHSVVLQGRATVQSRRRWLSTGSVAACGLVCSAVLLSRAAAAKTAVAALPTDDGLDDLVGGREHPDCPFCTPGHPCPEHLI